MEFSTRHEISPQSASLFILATVYGIFHAFRLLQRFAVSSKGIFFLLIPHGEKIISKITRPTKGF